MLRLSEVHPASILGQQGFPSGLSGGESLSRRAVTARGRLVDLQSRRNFAPPTGDAKTQVVEAFPTLLLTATHLTCAVGSVHR